MISVPIQEEGITGLEPSHRKVTLIETDNGWGWQDAKGGCLSCGTAEEALSAYLSIHTS